MSKILIKNASAVTGCGDSINANIEAMTGRFSSARLRLENFPAQNYLKDKRTVKVVSDGDRYGLAAVALLEKEMTASGVKNTDPYRTGLFTGISPASPFSNQNYFPAITSAGEGNAAAFGSTYTEAHPTTLLTGLPNNVLCYGSIILDAKGPNSNYTGMETSGHAALTAAASQLRCGIVDIAVAGGVSAHNNPVFTNMLRQNGFLAEQEKDFPGLFGTVLADGAVFLQLQLADEKTPGVELVSWSRSTGSANIFDDASNARGPVVMPQTTVMNRCLRNADVEPAKVGCVFVSGTGIPHIDGLEVASAASLLGGTGAAIVATARVTGNLMEAGGLFELPLFQAACAQGGFPQSVVVSGGEINSQEKPYALVLRSSIYGDVSCLLIKCSV